MGMLSQMNAKRQGPPQTGHTASYPVTAFPATAYLGNNRRVGGGNQSRPSPIGGAIGNATNFNPQHVVLTLGAIVLVGFIAWHIDNK